VRPWDAAPAPSRAPRRGFFALAVLLLLTWGTGYAEREGLRRAALTYQLASVEAMLNVITVVDVALGLGVVVSLLVLCLAPRSARVTVPAQVAATLAALGVLVRGGLHLLVSSGAFRGGGGGATVAPYVVVVATLADIAEGALLLLVIARVTWAARAHVAFAFTIVAFVLVLARLTAYALTALIGTIPVTLDTLDLVQSWAFLVYDVLLVWLCVHAGVVVKRIPDDLSA
jgi:hypothetical protein